MTAFHRGELLAQHRVGVEVPGGALRDHMTDQHRRFFEALPWIAVAGRDAKGPVATLVAGKPGFIRTPDARTLAISAPLDPADPATATLVPGEPVGILGIELPTRRRNRENGLVAAADANGFRVDVKQSFGNCPQYITPRGYRGPGPLGATETFTGLDADARALLQRADTFFVASGDGAQGLDVSHRGGRPGFADVRGDSVIVPDYSGNFYFNTLGNFVVWPRAALLVPDFVAGGFTHLQGSVEIIWEGPEVERYQGAERIWRLHVERGWRRLSASASAGSATG